MIRYDSRVINRVRIIKTEPLYDLQEFRRENFAKIGRTLLFVGDCYLERATPVTRRFTQSGKAIFNVTGISVITDTVVKKLTPISAASSSQFSDSLDRYNQGKLKIVEKIFFFEYAIIKYNIIVLFLVKRRFKM